jgi:hypothetical protein
MGRLHWQQAALGLGLGSVLALSGCGDQAFSPDPAALYTIKGVASRRCLGPEGGNLVEGVDIEISNCDNSSAQQFRFLQSNGCFSIKNEASGFCMDAARIDSEGFTIVVQNTCAQASSQQFTVKTKGDAVVITAASGDRAVGVRDGSTQNGATVGLVESSKGASLQIEAIGTSSDSRGRSSSSGGGL